MSTVPEGHQVAYSPEGGLAYRACGKWSLFVELERARRAGIPEALLDWSLERLLVGDGEHPLRRELLGWLEVAASVGKAGKAPSFLVTGKTAADRTRLAVSIARELVRRGARVKYTFAPRLAAEMKVHFGRSRESDMPQGELRPIDVAENAHILVFDFVDPKPQSREPWAEWFRAMVDMLLWRRLSAERPTVLVSRLSVQELMGHFEYASTFPVLECNMDHPDFGSIAGE